MENKNLLKKTRCYLCGGMQYVKDGRLWRETVKKELDGRNIIFFDPYFKPFVCNTLENESNREEMLHWVETEQYDLVTHQCKKIRNEDLRCCDLADWFICNITPNVASWGTAEELSVIVRERKPIFLVIDDLRGKKATPLWIFSMVPHKYIYNNLKDAIETIKAIDDGIFKISSDRFKLLKEEYR